MNSVQQTKAGVASGGSLSMEPHGRRHCSGVAILGAMVATLGRSRIDQLLPALPESAEDRLRPPDRGRTPHGVPRALSCRPARALDSYLTRQCRLRRSGRSARRDPRLDDDRPRGGRGARRPSPRRAPRAAQPAAGPCQPSEQGRGGPSARGGHARIVGARVGLPGIPSIPPDRRGSKSTWPSISSRFQPVHVEPGELPGTMAACVYREARHGEPKDAFQLEEIEVPRPWGLRGDRAGHGRRRELQQRRPLWGGPSVKPCRRRAYGDHPEFGHHIGGSHASGIVWKVGAGVTRWKPGDEVVVHCNQAS